MIFHSFTYSNYNSKLFSANGVPHVMHMSFHNVHIENLQKNVKQYARNLGWPDGVVVRAPDSNSGVPGSNPARAAKALFLSSSFSGNDRLL